MAKSWMGTGYDEIEKAWENAGGTGPKGPRRVWMKPDTTCRFMFLDDDPTTLWEHQFYFNGDWKNWEPCPVRNKFGHECPICSSEDKDGKPMYASYVGLHSVINMTPWFRKKGNREVNFNREIYAPKLGGDKKPGVLKKLKKIKAKHGRLRGLVFDIERPGENTENCGSEFDLVEEVKPDEIRTYGMDALSAYAERLNKDMPNDKQITVEKLWERNPWEAIEFENLIEPRPVDELRAMFATGGGGGGGGGEDFGDDDIPY